MCKYVCICVCVYVLNIYTPQHIHRLVHDPLEAEEDDAAAAAASEEEEEKEQCESSGHQSRAAAAQGGGTTGDSSSSSSAREECKAARAQVARTLVNSGLTRALKTQLVQLQQQWRETRFQLEEFVAIAKVTTAWGAGCWLGVCVLPQQTVILHCQQPCI